MLRDRRGESAQSATVLADLRASIQPATQTRCMAPNCPGSCEWPASGGRPARFCSRGCQERFDRERARLLEEVAAIEDTLARAPGPVDRKYLENQRSRRLWLLERYPMPYREQARLMVLDHAADAQQ